MLALILCAWAGIWCQETPPAKHKPPEIVTASFATLPIARPALVIPAAHAPQFFDPTCERQPPREFANHYHFAAKKYPSLVDECILAKQGFAESSFNPNAVSPAGAVGIAQIMSPLAKQYGIDPFNPKQSIFAQARYVAWQLARWTPGLGGRTWKDLVTLALAAYNWGIGNMLKSQRKHGWVTYAEAEPHLPKETRDYPRKILPPAWFN